MATRGEGMHVELLPLASIDPNPFASRLDEPDVERLSGSLAVEGQLSPIKVRAHPDRPGRYQVIFGHRRVRAAKQLGWERINAEVLSATDEQMISLALAENLERDNFTDYELGLIFKRLRDVLGKTQDQIAKMVGRSVAYVSQHLSMTELFDSPEIDPREATEVLQSLRERQARILTRVKDMKERLMLAKFVLKEKDLGVAQLERLVGNPRTLLEDNAALSHNWRECRAKDKQKINEIIKQTLSGLAKRDMGPFLSRRNPELFSLFDDFPPLELMDYNKAADHNSVFIRRTSDLQLRCENLNINIFKEFAVAAFFANYSMVFSGRRCHLKSRVTFIFIKKENQWFIIHEHWSPFSYDSGFKRLKDADSTTLEKEAALPVARGAAGLRPPSIN